MLKNKLFFLLCFFTIFNYIPRAIRFGFLAGPVQSQLAFYPLAIGLLYTGFQVYNKKLIPTGFKKVRNYLVYLGLISLTSLLLGLYNYPYYDLILNGPAGQIEKLPKVIDFFHSYGINLETKTLIVPWLILRLLKGLFFDLLYCFGGAYIIFLWYKDNWKEGYEILTKAVIASTFVLIVFGIIEVAFLAGNGVSKTILETIIPYIHAVKTNHNWWPPLLWYKQLRLVFPEPSHVGNYYAFALPLLWGMYLQRKSRFTLFASFALCFLCFFTKARTAYAMLVGMTILLLVLLVVSKRTVLIKRGAIIAASVVIAFGTFIGFENVCVQNSLTSQGDINELMMDSAKSELKKNLLSLGESNARSNGARYALIKSNVRIFLQYPLLGVGNGLSSAYIVDNFNDDEKKNKEVSNWVKCQAEYGPLAAGYSIGGALNEYVTRLAQNGLVGLIAFILPFILAVYKLFALFMSCSNEYNAAAYFSILLALISSMVAGCNCGLDSMYCVWILLGFGYVMFYGRADNRKEDNNEST